MKNNFEIPSQPDDTNKVLKSKLVGKMGEGYLEISEDREKIEELAKLIKLIMLESPELSYDEALSKALIELGYK